MWDGGAPVFVGRGKRRVPSSRRFEGIFDMVMKSLVIAALALSLSVGAAAAGSKHCPPGHAKKGECGGKSHGKHDKHYEKHHDDDQHDHGWRRGDKVEPTRYVVIERYRDYGYQPPPRGYHYVKIDGDVLLIAITTGIIADIFLNR
jgi:Ni/Co efflux regulator RcnB